MLYSKILVPYDKSEHAENALKEACKMASGSETELVVVSILVSMQESATYGGFGDNLLQGIDAQGGRDAYEKMRADMNEQATKNVVESIQPIIEGIDNKVSVAVVYAASPVSGILSAVDDFGCDAIVMGCRGLNAVRGMLGSVSYGVLRSCTVPVTIVK